MAFAASAALFLGLDSVWLEATADRLYRPALAHLMRDGFDAVAAAAFYAIYLAGMWFFAVLPARGWRAGLARGAAFGLVAYATYDLTNQATLRGWPWHVTLADLLWGALVTGVSCALGAALLARAKRLSR